MNRNLKYNAFENIFIYFKNAVHVISKNIRVPVCKAIVSIFQVSLYRWIFMIGSKLFVLKISIAWKKLIQWLTVDELYICNVISLHIWKKRCLNFRQTLKTKWKQKMQKWGLRNRWQMPKKNENKRSWFFRRIFKCVKFGVCVGIVTVHSGS